MRCCATRVIACIFLPRVAGTCRSVNTNWGTPLGYLGAFMTNGVHRKAMGAGLKRVVFSSAESAARGASGACLPFATNDHRTRQVPLTEANFSPTLQASCSIPFVLRSVRNIPGAPPGAYRDGGITDYHLHLDYATDLIADSAYKIRASCQNDSQIRSNGAAGSDLVPYRISRKLWRPAGRTRA